MSWQIVPVQFLEMMSSGTPAQIERVTTALFTMQKIDVGALQAAYAG